MAGSGFTTQEIVTRLRDTSANQFGQLLFALGRRKKAQEDECAAFRDGFNTAIRHLVGMKVIEITDETPTEPNNG